jgi:hypothetical protein
LNNAAGYRKVARRRVQSGRPVGLNLNQQQLKAGIF